MGGELWLIGIVAFVIGAVLPIGIRPLLVRTGAVDDPNERSSHTRPTLRGGGLATLIAVDIAIAVAIVLLPTDAAPLLVVLVTATLAAALGFVDDLVGLGSGLRLALQLAIGLGAGAAVTMLTGHPIGWALVIMVVIAGYVNTANFIDGINGISGAHGVVAGSALAFAGALSALPWLSVGGVVLAAAFASFLPWNMRRPGLFLGDVGSYLLGAVIAVLVVLALAVGTSPLLVLPVLAPWVADTAWVVIRRFARAEGVLSAHRTHAYQRLTDTGLSHGAVAVLVGAVSASSAALGLLAWTAIIPLWAGLALIVTLCALYLALPRLRGSRLPAAPHRRFTAPQPMPAAASSATPVRWVVVGASGFVGGGIVERLNREGVDVRELIAPRLEFAPDVHDGERIAASAAADPVVDEVAALLRGADVVINAAGAATPDADASRALFGANAYLPSVLALACHRAGVARFVHVSSAAVQGRTPLLDETPRYATFSPYSQSKALGELGLLALAAREPHERQGAVIVRATSVQGDGRATTAGLRRVASSRLASVAAPGSSPSAVSGLSGLADTIVLVGNEQGEVPGIVLQPWEGLSVAEVLRSAGNGHEPLRLPRWLCTMTLALGRVAGRAVPRISGLSRRLEMMWFGQAQDPGWAAGRLERDEGRLRGVLGAGGAHVDHAL
jgi:UDP-N-acetylmuramyl pentapeptide phosphotransferase/UDP-N-acetylglucosamine-1-phosphate transferase/dTDP-4-dehydrorhamnose reductase